MYGDAAGGTSAADKACQPYSPNFLMGQFGLWQLVEPSVAPALGLPPNPLEVTDVEVNSTNTTTNGTTSSACGASRRLQEWEENVWWDAGPGSAISGRRLQRRGSSGRRSKKQSAEVDYMLLAALGDQVTSGLAVLIVVIFVHEFLLFFFAHVLNRKFYRALREEEKTGVMKKSLPRFRGLPTALVFPRFHVTLFTVVVTGLVQTGANVLGAYLGPFEVAAGLVGFAFLTVAFVCGALFHQAMKVQTFYTKYIVCMVPAYQSRHHSPATPPHSVAC